MKLQTVRIPILLTAAWIIIATVLYLSAVNRYYLFNPNNAYPLRIVKSSTSGESESYSFTLQSRAEYEMELYPDSQNGESGAPDDRLVKIERAFDFFHSNMNSLYRLPIWLRFADSVCPVELVNLTFCYSTDPKFAGFRVGIDWLGFSVCVFGPVLVLWLLTFLWLWLCPTEIKVPS